MKKLIKLYLLLTLIVVPLVLAHAQSADPGRSARAAVYSDPKVLAAIDFLKDRLPQLVVENKAQAVEEYMLHYENLSQLDEADVLYLVGHFYSVVDDPKAAIPYFDILINDPRLGDDARMMLNLLLYYRAVDYIQNQEKEAAAPFLEDVMNRFSTGKYYPTYMFLWADLLAEDAEEARIQEYVNAYERNRDWIKNTFVKRRQEIIGGLDELDLDSFYANPDTTNANILKAEITQIQNDLQDLYNEFKSIRGLQFSEALNRISAEEMRLLDNFKGQIRPFEYLPEIDLALLASPEYIGPDTEVFNRYREGAILLKQLKDTSVFYGRVLDVMDRFFERRYELFVNEDETVVGKGFSDMELKRLMDIERNINAYMDVVARIDEIMSEPNYASLNIDLGPERQEYVEKIADLQNRKERYLAFRKHQDSVEEAIFTELLDEYYATYRDKRSLDELMPEVEDVMLTMIKDNYPKDQQGVIERQYAQAHKVGLEEFPIDDTFIANLDFLGLMVDYRKIRYQEQRRLAKADSLGEAEQQLQYQQIIQDKAELLKRYEDFVAANPGFQAMEQPSGGYLLNNAIIHYNMAELQYAVDLDNPEKALANYKQALEIEPDFYLRDHALYNIGYLSSEAKKVAKNARIEEFRLANPNRDRPNELKFTAADFREALDAYTELVDSGKYDKSPYYDEAVYRLGILYFLIGSDADEPVEYYAMANRRFDSLVDDPDSDYHHSALYQRAWVNLNQGDEESLKLALADFVTLIGAVDGEEITDKYLAQDYKNNSIDNIAYSLIALDGIDFNQQSKGVAEVRMAMAEYSDIKVKTLILDKAAEMKVDMEAPLQAIDFMELRLQTSPLELQNPAVVDSIIQLYYTPGLQLRPGSDLAAIRNSKYDFIKTNYGKDTQWYRKNVMNADLSAPVLRDQLQIIRDAYEQIRIRHYNNLLDSASEQDKQLFYGHVDAYQQYTELFEDTAELQAFVNENRKTDALLASIIAEKRNTPRDYRIAINTLKAFNQDFANDPDFFNNEGLIYKYTQRIYTLEDPGPENVALYNDYRDSALRFYEVLKASDSEEARNGAPAILMDLAAVELKHGHPEQAKVHYNTILSSGIAINRATSRSIYLNLAQIEESAESYTAAESMYIAAKAFANDKADENEIENLVRLQIQNNYEKAERLGDQETVATELIRLADKFASEPSRSEGYLFLASEAYSKAGLYSEAIELKTGLAKTKSSLNEKYALYEQSWTIAKDQMKDPAKARELKNGFIQQFPTTNLAFLLRVDLIEEMRKDPAQRGSAASRYIDLHNDVRSGLTDSGEIDPADIYLWAIDIYREDGDQEKVVETLTYFTKTYPDHPQTAGFLTLLADEYLALQDMQQFEFYARELYLKDNSKFERYLNVANRKLGSLAQEFDAAYAAKNWDLAFQKRDDFSRLESYYRGEGLQVETAKAHEAFAFAESEFETLQARQAYLDDFDRQLNNIERGNFLTSSPNQLMTVGARTTWQKHLFGGTPDLVPSFQARTELEVNKVVRLLDHSEADILDNERRLRALDMICRINDHAARVVETQIEKYIESSNEMAPFRDRSRVSQAEFDNLVNTEIRFNSQPYIDFYRANSTQIYLDIYNKYFTAGYYDQYTTRAEDKLIERNLLPEYTEQRYPLDQNWSAMLAPPEGSARIVDSGIDSIILEDGRMLSTFAVPARNQLILEREYEFEVKPEFAYVYLAYDQDPQIFINGNELDLIYIPVYEKDFGKVYALRIAGEALKEGANGFRGIFPNSVMTAAPMHFSTSFFFDSALLAPDVTTRTSSIVTDTTWVVVSLEPETNAEIRSYAIEAQNFDLPVERSSFLTNGAALPIWTNETQDKLQTTVVFEREFQVEAEFVDGYLDFVAPDSARLFLNGEALGPVYELDFDTDPFLVYPSRVYLPAGQLKPGANTLRLEVQNHSLSRGMMAELNLTLSAKE
ncbi:MAG: tetratricopeptide repeat protein [Candidatus Cloacimonadaceae bacterium]